MTDLNEPFGNPEQLASLEQRARERLPALARTHEGQKLYSLAYTRGRLKGRQDATVDLGVIGTADQPALGDHQDKALAWDAVCMALNTYAPGWANSEEKTGLQSAVAAIAALASQQGVGDRPAIDYERESLEALRIVEKVAIFNGGLIADDLDKVIAFIGSMRAEVSSIYAAIPTLPITPETAEQATNAFMHFCHAFNSMIESARDAQPAGDVGRGGSA